MSLSRTFLCSVSYSAIMNAVVIPSKKIKLPFLISLIAERRFFPLRESAYGKIVCVGAVLLMVVSKCAFDKRREQRRGYCGKRCQTDVRFAQRERDRIVISRRKRLDRNRVKRYTEKTDAGKNRHNKGFR